MLAPLSPPVSADDAVRTIRYVIARSVRVALRYAGYISSTLDHAVVVPDVRAE